MRWRCRRGTQELDLLLLTYLEHEYPHATPVQQQSFQDFLELEDSCLQQFLLGDAVPERDDFTELVSHILAGIVKRD